MGFCLIQNVNYSNITEDFLFQPKKEKRKPLSFATCHPTLVKTSLKPIWKLHEMFYLVSPILFVLLNTICKPPVYCHQH